MQSSPIYFILECQLNLHSVSQFSASNLIIDTLPFYNMAKSKVTRNLANLGVSVTNVDMNEGYSPQSKLRTNSTLHWVGENNLLSLQTIISNQTDGVLAGVTNRTSVLSCTNNDPNSINISQNSARMKCYFHYKQNCLLYYFDDPVPDDAVIYMSDVPFQDNEREGMYTEFIDNSTGIL